MEPNTLPPEHDCDQKVSLKSNSQPTNLPSHGYHYNRKTEIERKIKEMLQSAIIQPSHSPFASPVLLVQKKDNTWHFCVDYKRLNEPTTKDRFPTPLVDELLMSWGVLRCILKLI